MRTKVTVRMRTKVRTKDEDEGSRWIDTRVVGKYLVSFVSRW